MSKLLCKIFGHKKLWVFSRDGEREIYPRCGYWTYTSLGWHVLAKYMTSEKFRQDVRDGFRGLILMKNRVFEALERRAANG